jgi:hypothetical protein
MDFGSHQGTLMKKPFSQSWVKPQTQATPVEESQPLEGDLLSRINSYAESVLKTLQAAAPNATYDEEAIKRLSRDLTTNRSRYTPEQRVQLANMYGAFLGKAIITAYPETPAKWVRWKGDIGLEFQTDPHGMRKISFPITRVFKHIEAGDVDSIHSFFLAIPEFVASSPKAETLV